MSAASAPPRPVPPTDGGPEALVRWVFNVLNRHDVDAYRQVLAPDAIERLPSRTLHGADAISAYARELFTALPDAAFTLLALVGEGEEVMVRWRLAGTHSGGPLEGLEPTGRRVDLDGVDHHTVRDGRLVSTFVVVDRVQLARQLGLVPEEGSRLEVGVRTAFNALARHRRR
jgi:predicted ester cyclase